MRAADEVAERVAAERVAAEQDDVDGQDERADADAERLAARRASVNHIAFQTS